MLLPYASHPYTTIFFIFCLLVFPLCISAEGDIYIYIYMGKIAFALDRRYYFNPTFAFASKAKEIKKRTNEWAGRGCAGRLGQ